MSPKRPGSAGCLAVLAALVLVAVGLGLLGPGLGLDLGRPIRSGTAQIDSCSTGVLRHTCTGRITWDEGATQQDDRIRARTAVTGEVRVTQHARLGGRRATPNLAIVVDGYPVRGRVTGMVLGAGVVAVVGAGVIAWLVTGRSRR